MTDTTTAYEPQAGDFVSELLVTDTRVYEVTRRTASTLWLTPCRKGDVVKRENRDGNPWPLIWNEAIPYQGGDLIRVGRRKDGSYRLGSYAGADRLRPAFMIDGRPVTVTDYRA